MTRELTAERLREVLQYDPETGVFTRLVDRGGRKVGVVAGSVTGHGYTSIQIAGVRYLAHRLAFLWMTGEWPIDDVDHINGVAGDNRWSNLRPATRAENMQNQRRAQSNNKLGLLGVCRDGNRFSARIKVDGQRIHLGLFATPEQAHAAYLDAKRRLHED